MTRWIVECPDRPERKYEIQPDKSDAGFYLYVWQDGRCIKDHLQDSLQAAIDQAATDYGVRPELWQEVSD